MGRATDDGAGAGVHTGEMHPDRGDAPPGPADVTALLTAGLDADAAILGALGTHGARRATPTSGPTMQARDDEGDAVDPLQQFAALGPVLGGVVADIRPDQLDTSTPCAGFTVRDVLAHMIVGATMFAAAYRGTAPPAPDVDDVLAGFAPALGGLVDAVQAPGALERTIDAPFGAMDGESFARYVVLDGLVHGWDLAVATGQPYDPPAELVDAADAYARGMLDPLRDGVTFAAAVEPPAGATPLERLVAFTGRAPRPS